MCFLKSYHYFHWHTLLNLKALHKNIFFLGTMVQKQHAIRRNEYSSNGRSIESTYPHFEFNSVRSRFWQLLVCGRKFSWNFQVSSLLTFFFFLLRFSIWVNQGKKVNKRLFSTWLDLLKLVDIFRIVHKVGKY